ncbi:hypothetical protein QZH41_000139 [Actinostola sp. cb2023]|nr:hypothetical protein QZH41_000139 [Actinostola sp. cb2023]
MLTMLPMADGNNSRIYKNIFCALCNKAENPTYWTIQIEKKYNIDYQKPISEILAKNDWKAIEPEDLRGEKYCQPKFSECKNETANLLRMRSDQLSSLCNEYSFLVKICSRSTRIRNLHCMLCAGEIYSEEDLNSSNKPSVLPPQTIAFDFRVNGQTIDSQTKLIRYRCKPDTFYDPFRDRCLDINGEIPNMARKSGQNTKCIPGNDPSVNVLGNGTIIVNDTTRSDAALVQIDNSSYVCLNKTERPNMNCVPGNDARVTVLGNGTIIVNGTIRSDMDLVVIDNSSYVCWNKTRVFPNIAESLTSMFGLQVITTVGFALSTLFLVFLLATYILYADLRTTPGKGVMSLSCALLVYMACHVPLTSTSYPFLCVTNAIVFHFSLLSVFFWLSALAYDLMKRFGSRSK